MRSLLLIPLLCVFTVTDVGLTSEIRSNDSVRIAETDTLSSDLIAASRTVEILGRVDGDVFAAGQHLTVEGSIADNLTAAFQSIAIRGDVGGMVVAAAQTVVVDAEIGDDLYAFGSEVRITENGSVRGNVFAGCGILRLEGGRVDGWIHGGTGTAYLNGTVQDSVVIETESVQFGEAFAAKGTRLKVESPLDTESLGYLPENLKVVLKPDEPFYRSTSFYASFLSAFVIGVLMTVLFPSFTRNLLAFAGSNIAQKSGIGFLTLLGIPVAIIVLVLMILTIPLALITLVLYLFLLYFSSIIAGFFIGHYLLSRSGQAVTTGNLILALLLGLLIVYFLTEIHLLGWLFSLLFVCFGLGSLVTYFWSLRPVNVSTSEPE